MYINMEALCNGTYLVTNHLKTTLMRCGSCLGTVGVKQGRLSCLFRFLGGSGELSK